VTDDEDPTVAEPDTAADVDDGDGAAGSQAKRRRGWISLHAVAFALVLVSGALVVVASLNKLDEDALSLLRTSWWISGTAIVVAIASVVVPRRHP
jgi:hypothetical protein